MPTSRSTRTPRSCRRRSSPPTGRRYYAASSTAIIRSACPASAAAAAIFAGPDDLVRDQDAADPGRGHRGGLPDRRDRDADRACLASAAARCPGSSAPWCAGAGFAVWPSSAAIIVAMLRFITSTSTISAGVWRSSAACPGAGRTALRSARLARSQGCRQSVTGQLDPGGGVRIHGHGRRSFADGETDARGEEAGQVARRQAEGVLVEQPGQHPAQLTVPRPGPGGPSR